MNSESISSSLPKKDRDIVAADTDALSSESLSGTTSVWKLLLVAAVPVVTVLTCGARAPWALATLALLVGTCILLMPPIGRIPLKVWVLPALALLLSLTFALPVVGELPDWRQALQRDFQIDTGNLHSPQPWTSSEKWILVTLVLVWMAFVISRGFADGERRIILRAMVVGLTAIAALAVWIKLRNVAGPSFWARDNLEPFQYGPFPNRNHFSGMCAVTGILAFVCTYDSFRRRHFGWVLFAICLAICFAALMLNTSRFGVVMFFAGCGGWMLTATLRSQSAHKMALFSSLFLIGTTFLLIFGQRIIQRFIGEGDVVATLASDGRLSLFGRVLKLIPEAPWMGWGIGNFDPIFNMLDGAPNTIYRASHPENDLLWFAAESGVPAALCMVLGIIVLAIQFGPWRPRNEKHNRRDRRLRNAAAISALAIVAQSLVDIPLHMLGLAVLFATLAGLGYNPHSLLPQPSSRRWLHVPAALFCFAAAILWISVARLTPLMPTDTYARQLYRGSTQMMIENRNAEALELINGAAIIRPLHWEIYFQRASIKLALGYSPQEALPDFARSRALEKYLTRFVAAEAQIWAIHHPPFAMAAYGEAIRRDRSSSQNYFYSAMEIARLHPELRSDARAMALKDPKLHLIFTLLSDGEEFSRELQALLTEHPELAIYNKAERLSLFQAWHAKADRSKLVRALQDKPAWLADGWSVLATDHALQGDFQSACKIAFDHLDPPFATSPPGNLSVDELNRLYLGNPTDIARGLQLYETLKLHDRIDEALQVLEELALLPSVPNKVIYEKALILNQKKEYAKSWETLQTYMNKISAS
ncbi:O-antigen ligase family protein [Phragmitibacter flavus]|uniref:O-antigen ligase family protein n=1 Tax=Phragmitibacter flavus TaxID=2576071 RepID=A0A5R8KC84_9BACT|nr:O-antigen ligase family protein [Phragmitibacter flavus]TLD69933.1 O-antigen ligase family protein [Phragmitibacter flavus]